MARELILHIGHYKTGTTALQVFLDRNRALLAAQGLHYATAPVLFSKHSALAFSLLREAGVTELMHNFSKPETATALWQALFDEARALPDGEALLASSEELIRLAAHPAAFDLLRAEVATAPDLRFRVVAYLRAPQDHLHSWYNQLIKMGANVGGFAATVRAQMEPVHWDYALALRPWIELFGAEALVLRQFRSELRKGDALYSEFLEALGYAVPVLSEVPDGDPNPRLDGRLLPYKRALNRVSLRQRLREQMLSLATEGLEAEDAGEPRLDAETLRQQSEAGIALAAALPGASLDAEAMLKALPDLTEGPVERMEATIVLLASEIARLRGHVAMLSGRLDLLENTPAEPDESRSANGDDAA
ncbi:MAG: hypothetical protein KDK12_06115 [Rhodobacteraceae bacterium]|nr:hypothetical protein [Paracoccaceae bacterium]